MSEELLPAESIALTVGLAQVQRGEAPALSSSGPDTEGGEGA